MSSVHFTLMTYAPLYNHITIFSLGPLKTETETVTRKELEQKSTVFFHTKEM